MKMISVIAAAVAAAARATTCVRRTCVYVSLFRLLYRLRFILHSQSVHRCYHRQLQRTEEKGQTNFCKLFCRYYEVIRPA